MASPKYKIYDADGVYQASCKEAEAAAALVAAIYDGGTIRFDHTKKSIVWTEGEEEFSAGESYDGAAQIMFEREREIQNASYKAFCEKNGVEFRPYK